MSVSTNSSSRIFDISELSGQIIDSNGIIRVVNRAFVNATGAGNTELVAAQGSGIVIRVLSMVIVALTAITVKLQSATTDIYAGMPFGATGGIAVPNNIHGIAQTFANEALNLNLSGATTVGCSITWIQTT